MKVNPSASQGKNLVYDHKSIESKWQRLWFDTKLSEVDIHGAKRPFYNLMMFPYPSAEGLHVGNMYAFTGSDIFGRFKRMQGYSVFEPIGLDGFGIHSENYALKIGKHPMDQAKVSEKNFYRQLREIGCMFDWGRTVETYDPGYYRWTQWLFIQMFKHGLAYRGTGSVNWCPKDKTVLADEQVIDGKCERCGNNVEKRSLEQWFFRITAYAEKLLQNTFSLNWSEKVLIAQRNWIGKKDGVIVHHEVKDLDLTLDAFSAFPAWLWADTFLVIAPDHPVVPRLVKDTVHEKEILNYIKQYKITKKNNSTKADEKEGIFTGRVVIDPFSGAEMPVWLANFALMEFGTGIIRCSSHDPRDWAFAKKYKIALKEVVSRTNPAEPINAHANSGILQHSGPFSDRKISVDLIAEIVNWIVEKGIGERKTTYHLRDWLISRQRYWGPPIPMIYCKKCASEGRGERTEMPGWYAVELKDLPVLLPRIADYRPGDDGIAPLAKHKEFYETTCPGCGGKAVRETDVSDTFLDSSWYFLRYPSVRGDENFLDPLRATGSRSMREDAAKRGKRSAKILSPQTVDLPWDPAITQKWLPVSMYTGGAEHSVLHLMYSRFVTMALHDWGYLGFDEPFPNFYAHGLVIKEGAKMSKSKGNVVSPDQYIRLYGSDALRLYLMFMGPFDQGGDFRDSAMEGMNRWVGRVWRMAMKAMDQQLPSSSAMITSALQKAIIRVTDDIGKRRYNTAIATMMEWTNLVGEAGGSVGVNELRDFLKLLSPFAPHLTEELWQHFHGHKTFKIDQSIHLQPWPKGDASKIAGENAQVIVQVNGKLRAVLGVGKEESLIQKYIETMAKKDEKVQKYLDGKPIKKVIFIPGRIINFVV